MEEIKQILEFVAPEIKVVNIAPQRVLCESSSEPEEASIRTDALNSYSKVYF